MPKFLAVQDGHEFHIDGADDWVVEAEGVHFVVKPNTPQAEAVAFISHPCVVLPAPVPARSGDRT